MAKRNQRRKPSKVWAEKALTLAGEILGEISGETVDPPPAMSVEEHSARARDLVLRALYGKWRAGAPMATISPRVAMA